jgi:hypothetical protein
MKLWGGRNDYVTVYFCINFDESESQMKAIIEYDLFNSGDAYAYKCSQRAVEAFQMLETIADDIEVYLANKTTSEACLIDIQRLIYDWRASNNV